MKLKFGKKGRRDRKGRLDYIAKGYALSMNSTKYMLSLLKVAKLETHKVDYLLK